jgi:lysine/ornithine N-monooxygenase
MPTSAQVAIVGAGPYGLSIAAHLRARGVTFRIFGLPMHSWRTQMPKGMWLKSEGFASNLYDPDSSFTLRHFCKEQGHAYSDLGLPIRLDVLAAYGLSFQERFVPDLETKQVTSLERSSDGFLLRLEDGEMVLARAVVLAVGISHFHYIPENLAGLPAEFVSHSGYHHDLDRFKGRDVTVIGSGASAVDLAGLLHESGAVVRLVARRSSISFHSRGTDQRTFWERVRAPMSKIGPGWRSVLYTDAPLLFHYLPQAVRSRIVATHPPAAPGWFMKDRVEGKIPLMFGCAPLRARINGERVQLDLVDGQGVEQSLMTEHVIAATGYKVDLRRLAFLPEQLRLQLQSIDNAPILSPDFQSSVAGLYFVGPSSANSFGPAMRFIFGAEFAARQIAAHVGKSLSRGSAPMGVPARAAG